MLDHCVRCGCKKLKLVGTEQVLVDGTGLTWFREDLRCPVCEWTDADYRAENLNRVVVDRCACTTVPVVKREVTERRLSAAEKEQFDQAVRERVREILKDQEITVPGLREALDEAKQRERIQLKIRRFEG